MTYEEKLNIVINNYFKDYCDVNTSIRQAFERGFRLGVEKGKILAQKIDCDTDKEIVNET